MLGPTNEFDQAAECYETSVCPGLRVVAEHELHRSTREEDRRKYTVCCNVWTEAIDGGLYGTLKGKRVAMQCSQMQCGGVDVGHDLN